MALTNGIDISKWQKGLVVSKVPSDFVIIKATEGVSYTDPCMKDFATQITKCGKKLGFYHFASGKTTGKREAEFFVKVVKDYIGKALLVLDWEGPAEKKGPAYAKEFSDTVFALTKVRPVLYINANCLKVYDWTSYSKSYPTLWLAKYLSQNTQNGYATNPDPKISNWKGFQLALFQYSSKGKLPNYGSNLDLDKSYINEMQWDILSAVGGVIPQQNNTTTTTKPTNNTTTVPKPVYTVDQVAQWIVDGANGWNVTGAARKSKVESVGLSYVEVQKKINELVRAKNANKPVVNTAVYYTIKKGDTLNKVAKTYNTTVSAIMKLNPSIKNANIISVGQKIRVK